MTADVRRDLVQLQWNPMRIEEFLNPEHEDDEVIELPSAADIVSDVLSRTQDVMCDDPEPEAEGEQQRQPITFAEGVHAVQCLEQMLQERGYDSASHLVDVEEALYDVVSSRQTVMTDFFAPV